jgi:hypothetical protein
MSEIGNRDMKIHRCKMMLYSIQSSAGPEKIRPEDGLPASFSNSLLIMSIEDAFPVFTDLMAEFTSLMVIGLLSVSGPVKPSFIRSDSSCLRSFGMVS